jgi:hypothetical protein
METEREIFNKQLRSESIEFERRIAEKQLQDKKHVFRPLQEKRDFESYQQLKKIEFEKTIQKTKP